MWPSNSARTGDSLAGRKRKKIVGENRYISVIGKNGNH
jgi:hypothetical protein